MTPAIIGDDDRPELGEEPTERSCRTDPQIAPSVRRSPVPFRQPGRPGRGHDPTLVLQCRQDVIAPVGVEHVANVIGSGLVVLDATGHCPNLSAPNATPAAIRDFARS
jgi:sigma-B regulation protein RsbQ